MITMVSLARFDDLFLSDLLLLETGLDLLLYFRNYFLLLSNISLFLLQDCLFVDNPLFTSLFGPIRILRQDLVSFLLNFGPFRLHSFTYLPFGVMIPFRKGFNFLDKRAITFLQSYLSCELELLILKTLSSLFLALSVDWTFRSRCTFR